MPGAGSAAFGAFACRIKTICRSGWHFRVLPARIGEDDLRQTQRKTLPRYRESVFRNSARLKITDSQPASPVSPRPGADFRRATRAVPPGSRRARQGRAWIEEVLADEEFTGFRVDRQRNWEAIIRALATCRDWKTCTTRPTWDRLASVDARYGRSLHRSTVARCLRWLRDRGYIGVVETGSTPRIRAERLNGRPGTIEGNIGVVETGSTPRIRAERLNGRPGAIEGNRAALYVLTVKDPGGSR